MGQQILKNESYVQQGTADKQETADCGNKDCSFHIFLRPFLHVVSTHRLGVDKWIHNEDSTSAMRLAASGISSETIATGPTDSSADDPKNV